MWLTTTTEPRDKVTLTSVFGRNGGGGGGVGGWGLPNHAEQSRSIIQGIYQGWASADSRPFEQFAFLDSSVGGE